MGIRILPGGAGVWPPSWRSRMVFVKFIGHSKIEVICQMNVLTHKIKTAKTCDAQ